MKSILLGVFSGIITAIYLSEYFQFSFALLLTFTEVEIIYKYFIPHNLFTISETNSAILIILLLAPQIFLIIILEILNFFIKKTMLGFYRYYIMIFNLFVQGFLLLSVFYNSLIMIITDEKKNDFVNLAFNLGMRENGKIILAFLIILATVVYLNFTSKKVIKYINY